MPNSGVHPELWTELFIWTTDVDSSNSVNHDRTQVFSYRKYFVLFLLVVEIEPAISRWFHLEALSNQLP